MSDRFLLASDTEWYRKPAKTPAAKVVNGNVFAKVNFANVGFNICSFICIIRTDCKNK